MEKKKSIPNPYTRLLNDIRTWCFKAKNRHTVVMFLIKKEQLNTTSFYLGDVYERVKAAEALGYDVSITAQDDGLRIKYVKKVPEIPFEWQ